MSVVICHRISTNYGSRGWRRFGDIRAFNIILLAAIAILFASYLAANNLAASSGFTVRGLENRIAELEGQQRHLDLQVLDRQAMSNVEAKAAELGFVPVSGEEYLTAAGGSVALK